MSTDICKKCGSPLLAGEGTMMIRGADVKYALRNGKMQCEVGGVSGYWCIKCVNERSRTPMLSDEEQLKMLPFVNGAHEWMSGSNSTRNHYESLITSGALIRRDELVAWLEKQRDEQSASLGNSYTLESAVYDSIIHHINKKQS